VPSRSSFRRDSRRKEQTSCASQHSLRVNTSSSVECPDMAPPECGFVFAWARQLTCRRCFSRHLQSQS